MFNAKDARELYDKSCKTLQDIKFEFAIDKIKEAAGSKNCTWINGEDLPDELVEDSSEYEVLKELKTYLEDLKFRVDDIETYRNSISIRIDW